MKESDFYLKKILGYYGPTPPGAKDHVNVMHMLRDETIGASYFLIVKVRSSYRRWD